jgi:hypothetical protein
MGKAFMRPSWPHILFTDVSDAKGIDETIVKGEVLAILAAMITSSSWNNL